MTNPTARPLAVGTNFKMHQTPAESVRFLADLMQATESRQGDTHLFVIPPFTSLAAVANLATGSSPRRVWVGAQNMHWAEEGAYTGEISARMLQALGVDLVLLGHAERRRLFGETDDAVNRKVLAATAAGFRVLLCVGETAEEKGYGAGPESVARQLKIALHGLEPAALGRLLVAYEPVWSIGTDGTPAEPSDVAAIVPHLRGALDEGFGNAAGAVPILYGGSVDPANCGAFVRVPGVDGLFVGRAAWQVDGFVRILDAALAARSGAG